MVGFTAQVGTLGLAVDCTHVDSFTNQKPNRSKSKHNRMRRKPNLANQREEKRMLGQNRHWSKIPRSHLVESTCWTYQLQHAAHAAMRRKPQFFQSATTASQCVTKALSASQPCQLVHWKIGRSNSPSTFERRLIATLMIDKGFPIDKPS